MSRNGSAKSRHGSTRVKVGNYADFAEAKTAVLKFGTPHLGAQANCSFLLEATKASQTKTPPAL